MSKECNEKELKITAEQLYLAVSAVLHDGSVTGLMVAVGDAKIGVPYDQTAEKTKHVFEKLVENLTRIQRGE